MKVNVGGRAAMGQSDVGWTEREKENKSEEEDEGGESKQKEGGGNTHPIHKDSSSHHPTSSHLPSIHHPSMEGTTRPLTLNMDASPHRR